MEGGPIFFEAVPLHKKYLFCQVTLLQIIQQIGLTTFTVRNIQNTLFHGSPDLTLKRKCQGGYEDDRAVVVHKTNTDDNESDDDESDCESSDYSDVAILENKQKPSIDVAMINKVILPKEKGEVLTDLHSLLVKKVQILTK